MATQSSIPQTLSVKDVLLEENRILRQALTDIIEKYPPQYAYASARSHPDTNTAHMHVHIAYRALSAADDVSRRDDTGDSS